MRTEEKINKFLNESKINERKNPLIDKKIDSISREMKGISIDEIDKWLAKNMDKVKGWEKLEKEKILIGLAKKMIGFYNQIKRTNDDEIKDYKNWIKKNKSRFDDEKYEELISYL